MCLAIPKDLYLEREIRGSAIFRQLFFGSQWVLLGLENDLSGKIGVEKHDSGHHFA